MSNEIKKTSNFNKVMAKIIFSSFIICILSLIFELCRILMENGVKNIILPSSLIIAFIFIIIWIWHPKGAEDFLK